ncbi:DNA packaging protein UL32 [Equid alphaherpesvirus 3]|uniref:Packaging protein UL32 n=1 Tax=Equid alphaherpesvirus 3 TaxID=80341 RepID=A0A077B5Y4_9ALPH|nr:DNA packaging protein UL32 [Equid alphaherpesvirus 3]AIL02945.1 DNA packaging protein UL32 [Equid alphaherpesvirus 3]
MASGAGGGGWAPGAFEVPYSGFDASLLSTNSELCSELVFAAHLMRVPQLLHGGAPDGDGEDGDADEAGGPTRAPFVDAVADSLALDKPCLVCRTIDLYRRRFGLRPAWIADYAMLCAKCLAAPPCAVATVAAAFEFVYLMDRHYLARGKTTLVGAFARRVLTLVDIQRHFFLHVCFRTDGGVPRGPPAGAAAPAACPGVADKVQYSNYSFLVQSSTRALLSTVSDAAEAEAASGAPPSIPRAREQGGAAAAGAAPGPAPRQQSLAAALLGWKECARMLDCSGPELRRAGGAPTCCERARLEDAEYERLLLDTAKAEGGDGGSESEARRTWGYADLALLLLSKSATWEDGERTARAARSRRECVEQYWAAHRAALARDTAPRFSRFAEPDAEPDADAGPVLATTVKHVRGRGRTCAECVLCNLMLTREHWLALRRFKRDVTAYSANNANLFDCIPPTLEALAAGEGREGAEAARTEEDERADRGGEAECEGDGLSGRRPNDGGRFVELMRAAGTEAIYKHFFCDPMCALSELHTNPGVLFSPPGPPPEPDELNLQKARLARENRFGGRVCAGLWALAYTFKTYQVFPPKPTAGAAFIKDAGLLLRRHNLPLISLEHTLCNYV